VMILIMSALIKKANEKPYDLFNDKAAQL
jgi:hypothetical protein